MWGEGAEMLQREVYRMQGEANDALGGESNGEGGIHINEIAMGCEVKGTIYFEEKPRRERLARIAARSQTACLVGSCSTAFFHAPIAAVS